MALNNFHYGMSLCQQMYGIDLKEEDYEELGLLAFGLIGNKRTKIYRYTANIDCNSDNIIELPCNADILEAVTTSWEDWSNTNNYTPNGDLSSALTEEYIEHRKRFHDPLYQSGKFIKYERVGDTLYLDRPYRQVNILYRGIILDDEGLPEITEKEAMAIATYCAYITKFREGLQTNNPNIILLANSLKQLWNVLCDQARISDYLNQNELDLILEAKTSWNRKVHSKSWKPVR